MLEGKSRGGGMPREILRLRRLGGPSHSAQGAEAAAQDDTGAEASFNRGHFVTADRHPHRDLSRGKNGRGLKVASQLIPEDPLFAPIEWAPFSPGPGESGRRGFRGAGFLKLRVLVVFCMVARKRVRASDPRAGTPAPLIFLESAKNHRLKPVPLSTIFLEL